MTDQPQSECTAGALSWPDDLLPNGWAGLGSRFESVANCGVVAARSLRCAGVGLMIVAA